MFPSRLVSVLGKGAGENNYSLDFDGTNDLVKTGGNVGITGDTARTVTCWAKFDSITTNQYLFIFGEADTRKAFGMYQSSGAPGAFYYITHGSGNDVTLTAGNIVVGQWHHLAHSYGGSTTNKGYLDGVLIGTNSLAGALNTTASILRIGDRISEDLPFNGRIDEFAIWDKELSAGDISALYQARGTSDLNDDGNSENLVGWWRFEEGSGTSAIDSSANSNTGTLTNGPTYSTDVPS